MCGIAGILSLRGEPVTADDVAVMCSALLHRGPDEGGYLVGSGVGLGMRRLNIIDLATGQQPIHNEDASVWVVFNGEIYNYRELRAELESEGHRFYTSSDTEVLVHLYEELGSRCVTRLRGMFAFAIWNERTRELMLARDRLGKKPLYYVDTGDRLIFASEIKAILQLPEVERRLNWHSVNHLFTFLCTPSAESIVRGIRKLEPGHVLMATADGISRIERYWSCEFEPDYEHDEEYFIEGIRSLIEESVKLRLVSDVPIGAFLSGGIDSSAVVAAMARNSGSRVKTFSIGFDDRDFDELEHARAVARRFDTDHHELVVEPDVVQFIEEIAWYLDEPFGDSSAIPSFMVSKLASEHVKVLLSGDGGDEIFAGYDRYLVEQRERQYPVLPAPLRAALGRIAASAPVSMPGRNLLRHFSLPELERYLDASTLFAKDEKKRLFRPESFEALAGDDPWRGALERLRENRGHWLSAVQRFDLTTYLPLDILTKVDRTSMAHSIEVRAPLLDHELVEFAARIPPELQLRNGTTKHLFKRAMRGILPDSIIDRPKHGFAVPLGRWFRGTLSGFVRELLLSQKSTARGIFEPRYVERLIERQEAGRPLDLQIWTLMSFELWCRTFLDRKTAPAFVPPAQLTVAVAPVAAR